MKYKVWIGSVLVALSMNAFGCGAGLVRLVNNRLVIAEEIHFASNSDEILPESNGLLDELARFIQAHSRSVAALRIIGHTDRVGAEEANQNLSERRAAAVVAALEARGVVQPMRSEGRGESEPVCTEETEECNALNRRVEMIVLSNSVFPTRSGDDAASSAE